MFKFTLGPIVSGLKIKLFRIYLVQILNNQKVL